MSCPGDSNGGSALQVSINGRDCLRTMWISDRAALCVPPSGGGADLAVQVRACGVLGSSWNSTFEGEPMDTLSRNLFAPDAQVESRVIPGLPVLPGLAIPGSIVGGADAAQVPPSLPAVVSYAPPVIDSVVFFERGSAGGGVQSQVHPRGSVPTGNATLLEPLAVLYPGGGERLVVLGSGFGTDQSAPGASILLGGFACTGSSIVRHNDTAVECISTPAGGGEDLPLVVDIGGQRSRENQRALVRYTAPVVDVVFPPTGLPQQGGAEFLVVGAGFGFVDGLRIEVSLGPYECINVTRVRDDRITCVSPPGIGGNHLVTVLIEGAASEVGDFGQAVVDFERPSIQSIDPSFITVLPDLEAVNVTLIGTGFGAKLADVSNVAVGSAPCSSIEWLSNTRVVCVGVDPRQFRVPTVRLCTANLCDS